MKNNVEGLQDLHAQGKKKRVSRRSFLTSSGGVAAVMATGLWSRRSAPAADTGTSAEAGDLPAAGVTTKPPFSTSKSRSSQLMSNDKFPGKTAWYFPDAYLPDTSNNISHEALCVLNMGDADAKLDITLFYEDRDPVGDFLVVCPSKRTRHIRLDKLTNKSGMSVQQLVGYSIRLLSDQPVLCQYTRVDATKPSYSLMTAMGL